MKNTAFNTIITLLFIIFSATAAAGADNGGSGLHLQVRVEKGGHFVSGLNCGDFAVYSGGNKLEILNCREFSRASSAPGRELLIFFALTDYNSLLEGALQELVTSGMQAADQLTLITPRETYTFNAEALKKRPVSSVVEELRNTVRRDIVNSGKQYKTLLNELKRLSRSLRAQSGAGQGQTSRELYDDFDDSAFGIESAIQRYQDTLQRIENLRLLDNRRLANLVRYAGRRGGPAVLYVFHEKEYKPEIEAKTLTQMMTLFTDRPDIAHSLGTLFGLQRRQDEFDPRFLLRLLAENQTVFNVISVRGREQEGGLDMSESSSHMHQVFSFLTENSGGIYQVSGNPLSGIQEIIKTEESGYLLELAPPADRDFLPIEVRLAAEDLKLKYPRLIKKH